MTEQSYWAPTNNSNLPAVPNLTGGTNDTASTLTAVATYHSIGLVWDATNGGVGVQCQCTYTETGGSAIHGLDLWWDDRAGEKEYRGSVVHLKENTEYTIRCKIDNVDGDYREVTITTWEWEPGEDTVTNQEDQSTTLVLTSSDSGSDVNNWNVWQFGTIDVEDGADYCVELDGCQYVILRGLTLVGGSILGIRLTGGSTDIIIEDCEISEWGRFDSETGYGRNDDSAIANRHEGGGSEDTATARITVRRCKIHSPRYDTNAWDEPIELEPNHPVGPSAIFLGSSQGNHVLAYNEAYSGNGNKFKDGFHGRYNTSALGFPGDNSDIYGNIVRDVWDDAIEVEGGNRNVRVWGNYVDTSLVAFATVVCHFGPIYFWRNVVDKMMGNNTGIHGNDERMGKHTGIKTTFGGGRMYFFNNLSLQSNGDNDGINRGLIGLSSPDTRNLYTRNNWFWLRGTSHGIKIAGTEIDNDLDYDATNGGFTSIPTGNEDNGLTSVTPIFKNGVPGYSPILPTGDYELDSDSPGYEDGVFLPNFNANMQSSTPDIGAHEKNQAPMMFGISAFIELFLQSAQTGHESSTIETNPSGLNILSASMGHEASTITTDPVGLNIQSAEQDHQARSLFYLNIKSAEQDHRAATLVPGLIIDNNEIDHQASTITATYYNMSNVPARRTFLVTDGDRVTKVFV